MSSVLFNFVLSFLTFASSRCLVEVETIDDPGFKFYQAKSSNCSLHFKSGHHAITSKFTWLYWPNINGSSTDPIEIYGDGRENTQLTQSVGQNILNLGGSYFILRDIELEGGDGGVRVQTATSYANFKNLKIHGTSGHAFYTQQETQYIRISNIEMYDTNSANMDLAPDCIYLGANFHNNKIDNIYCHGNNVKDGISFKSSIGCYSNVIEHNVIIGTSNRGIVLLQDDNGLGNNIIRNNIILQIPSRSIHIFAGVELYNNIIHSISSYAILASWSSNSGAKNIKIIGNTIVTAGGTCLYANGWDINASTFSIVNNLFLCGTDGFGYEQALSFSPSNSVVGTINIENNAFYSSDNGNLYGTSNIQLSSIKENVQDYANYNFYPFSYSQFINSGVYLAVSNRDADCVIRGDPSDIGAYEYIAAKTQPDFYINAAVVVSDFSFPDLCATFSPTTPTTDTSIFPAMEPSEPTHTIKATQDHSDYTSNKSENEDTNLVVILILILICIFCAVACFILSLMAGIKIRNHDQCKVEHQPVPIQNMDTNKGDHLQIANVVTMKTLIENEEKQQVDEVKNNNYKSDTEELYVKMGTNHETKRDIEMYKSNIVSTKYGINNGYESLKSWFNLEVNIPNYNNIYYQLFVDNGYDTLEIVQLLNEDKLRKMKIKKQGHIDKIMLEINNLKFKAQYNETEGGRYNRTELVAFGK